MKKKCILKENFSTFHHNDSIAVRKFCGTISRPSTPWLLSMQCSVYECAGCAVISVFKAIEYRTLVIFGINCVAFTTLPWKKISCLSTCWSGIRTIIRKLWRLFITMSCHNYYQFWKEHFMEFLRNYNRMTWLEIQPSIYHNIFPI